MVMEYAGAVITGMGPQESGIHSNDWVPPANGILPDVAPISGPGKVSLSLCSSTVVLPDI